MKNLFLSLIAIALFACDKNEQQASAPKAECQTCNTVIVTTTYNGGNASTEDTSYTSKEVCGDSIQYYDGHTHHDTTYDWNSQPSVAHWSHTECQ
jgi:hypothetical protein